MEGEDVGGEESSDYQYSTESYDYYEYMYPKYFYELPSFQNSLTLWKNGFPITMSMGSFGNLLTFLVMLRRSYWQEGCTGLYIVVLCVVDTICIAIGYVRFWVFYVYGYDIRGSEVACKYHTYTMYVLIHFKAWVLVKVIFERAAWTYSPERALTAFTKKRALYGLIGLLLVCSLVNLNLPLYNSIDEYGYCQLYTDPQSTHYFYNLEIYPWIDLVLTTVAPFIVLIALNATILMKIYSSETTSTETKSASLMMVARCVTFVVLNFPICVLMVVPWWDQAYNAGDWHKVANYNMAWALANFFVYLDFSINFFIFFGITKFRRELKDMLCCKKQVHPGQVQSEIQTNRLADITEIPSQIPCQQIDPNDDSSQM